jgi:hypothetical protein
VGVVARCVALRITAALSSMSVSIRSSNNSSSSDGRLRVKTGGDDCYLLEDEGERIIRWGERAPLRAKVRRISRSEGRRLGGTKFFVPWRHAKEKTERQTPVRTTTRTCA